MLFNQRQFLLDYGYLSDADQEITPEVIRQAQATYELPQTGVMDELTSRVLARTPRCGVRDMGLARDAQAIWGVTRLTYYLASLPAGIDFDPGGCAAILAQAFEQWEAVCGLSFERVGEQQDANLVISTGRGGRAGFDGPSGTLAWAQLPPGGRFRGQLLMRFDLDEAWAKNPGGGRIGLLHVACHEFGHLIGLEHSQTPGQLMNPFYTPRISRPQAEDAARAKKYYGPARETPPAPSPDNPSPDNPQPPGGPLSVSQLEILLRVNGDDKLVIGPQAIDLSKRKLRLVAEE